MVETFCTHVWRAVEGNDRDGGDWKVLEQCDKCGEYRQRTIHLKDDKGVIE